MEQVMDWIYGEVVKLLNSFFSLMGSMSAELFNVPWIEAITAFFSYLGWALFVVGLVVAMFDCAIDVQNGRGSVKTTALNAIKGFMAVSLFTTLPVELYKFSVSLQGQFGNALAGLYQQNFDIAHLATKALANAGTMGTTNAILNLILIILMGYAVIKVFFANLKRGGILLIMIAVGSLHMFSVPRGYSDGFTTWCKQVVGLCLTAFLQAIILTAGLLTWDVNPLLGVGLMLAAGEVPRIAGQFGLDTSTKGNIMSTVYAAQTAVNMTKSLTKVVAK